MKFIISIFLFAVSFLVKADPSILVYNQTTDTSVIAQNTQTVRPLASITKLMTALVALESGIELDKKIKLVSNWPAVLPRKTYSREELLTAMLIRSDNAAAETLAEDYPNGRNAFLTQMNLRAQQLGMSNTYFIDASGLNKGNVSTTEDIQKLLLVVYKNEFIRKTSPKEHAEFQSVYKHKTQKIVLQNTNSPALFEFKNIVITKTGLTNAAGWCVALVVENREQLYTVVILGAKNKKDRLDKLKEIMYNHIIK